MIQLSHIYKRFNHHKSYVINDISLEIKRGETFVILGSSGSGKTTLLKMINRLVQPTHGEIRINNIDIQDYEPKQLRRSIGYVFQKVGLFPHMTVVKNIAIVLELTGKPIGERNKKAEALLKLVGLDPIIYAKRYPHELSGGQSQRVGVARALATNPEILLMDEPFGALDAITRKDLQETMLNLKKQINKTIIFVTHDILEAFRLADRIAIMHDGKLEQVGKPSEISNHPKTEFVRKLLETTKFTED